MTDHVQAELKRLATLHDTDRLARMAYPDLAAELEDIANRYLDLAEWLIELRAAKRRQVEQKGVAVVRPHLALVQP